MTPDFDTLTDKANHEHSLLEQEAEREMKESEPVFAEWLVSEYRDEMWQLFAAVAFPSKENATAAAKLTVRIQQDWMDQRPHGFTWAETNRIIDRDDDDNERGAAEDRAAERDYYRD